ncbi:MAG: RnfH family protein [Candidatus Dactylopiibacterium carminicum]|uniref:UPF0125 protein BGI27_02450 n=1 Tax=Candidatus Dactylopiibacterium carminicum TaxID=857335 RepID=A0A272EY39_9RHOO|nr:RnfH family protein [Candidatus Dactylopiibacterium carminicum]KAF7600423.1 RnfH family protein [Candidatus Dactylopiibacterium carminicum]PAS95044.1 MAG: RnfH family protein [Candidatus Dactylopiibacterium carminicum]PAS97847.1 MAG: RnfH family protein [Candidatus Dactylopiibacterium carminicum]PAT00422.1 MAG: RnfH family protein [Candidatus Dactylopiibacterium carminicum]
MRVSVAYTEGSRQAWKMLDLPEGVTVREAIDASGVLQQFPHIDLASQRIGIFGKPTKPDVALREGDRVEIYRQITCDPLSVPRRPGFELDSDDD